MTTHFKPGEVDAGDQRYLDLPPVVAAVLHRLEQKHMKAKRWRWITFAAGLVVGVVVGSVL
jgi:hypothetical protein